VGQAVRGSGVRAAGRAGVGLGRIGGARWRAGRFPDGRPDAVRRVAACDDRARAAGQAAAGPQRVQPFPGRRLTAHRTTGRRTTGCHTTGRRPGTCATAVETVHKSQHQGDGQAAEGEHAEQYGQPDQQPPPGQRVPQEDTGNTRHGPRAQQDRSGDRQCTGGASPLRIRRARTHGPNDGMCRNPSQQVLNLPACGDSGTATAPRTTSASGRPALPGPVRQLAPPLPYDGVPRLPWPAGAARPPSRREPGGRARQRWPKSRPSRPAAGLSGCRTGARGPAGPAARRPSPARPSPRLRPGPRRHRADPATTPPAPGSAR
jgi:hypothetical protein